MTRKRTLRSYVLYLLLIGFPASLALVMLSSWVVSAHAAEAGGATDTFVPEPAGPPAPSWLRVGEAASEEEAHASDGLDALPTELDLEFWNSWDPTPRLLPDPGFPTPSPDPLSAPARSEPAILHQECLLALRRGRGVSLIVREF